jgi:hypothetical protein
MDISDKLILDTLMHIENEIQSMSKELSSIKDEIDAESSEETTRVFKFLYNLERLSFSKQFNPEVCLQKHFGFSEEKAEKYLFNFIENLSDIGQKYSPSTASVVSESSLNMSEPQVEEKKRKGPKPYSEMTPDELATAKAKKLEKAKLAAIQKIQLANPESIAPVVSPEPNAPPNQPIKPKRVLKSKKSSDGIKIWNSFLKIIKAEVEASGGSPAYDDLVKKAKEMKEADPAAYELFSSTWTPDDDSSSSNA